MAMVSPETITRTYRVSDESGNYIDVRQTIVVANASAPEIVCPENIEKTIDLGLASAIITFPTPTVVNPCGEVTVNQIAGLPSGAEFPLGTTTITFEATDNAGNSTTCSFEVIIEAETDQTKYGFSPDGDGINEYWEIDGITNYPNNRVLIYNRWGDLVFEVKGYNNTTKVFRGIANRKRNLGADKLPEGTYFFHIIIDGPHHLKKEKGFLVLKR